MDIHSRTKLHFHVKFRLQTFCGSWAIAWKI